MSAWNAMTYEGKDTILRVVREEAERMFALAEAPGAWERQTACENWEVRDVIGHIVDTTEGYFRAFETARSGGEASALGLAVMHEKAGESGKSFRDIPQAEMMTRVRADLSKIMEILGALTEDEWGGLIVPHTYMGPVPAFIYAAGQLMDYCVHTWDIRQGMGINHALPGEAADLLAPFMFIIWQNTIKPDADTSAFTVGISVTSGANAGSTRVSVSPDGMTYEPGDVSDLPAVLEFDAGSMVLTAFGRTNTGTVRGDIALGERFLNLFYRI